jgi:hypothetical protein
MPFRQISIVASWLVTAFFAGAVGGVGDDARRMAWQLIATPTNVHIAVEDGYFGNGRVEDGYFGEGTIQGKNDHTAFDTSWDTGYDSGWGTKYDYGSGSGYSIKW